jgi:hypothetical protein
MTVEEQLAKFVEDGCALSVSEVPALLFPAVAEISEEAGGLFFVTQFANDQHDTHLVSFDEIRLPHDLGIELRRGNRLVAYVAPYAEWPELNVDDARAERAHWLKFLEAGENRELFDRFVETAKSIGAEAP